MLRIFLAIVLMLCVVFAVYLAADRYMRFDQRRRLEQRHADGDGGGLNREDFVQKGMAEYERSTEKKLLIGVFAIPILVVAFLALLAK
ncbi:MAG: hypothetical protein AAF577_10890 [Pseudomonadota bacterium]